MLRPLIASATVILALVGNHGAVRPVAVTRPGPAATIRAALVGFNTADCVAIYAATALWVRGSQPRAATIATCRQGFTDGYHQGVTLLRLTVDGPGRYLSTGAYRQPLLLRRIAQGRAMVVRETMQLARWHGHWYVLTLW